MNTENNHLAILFVGLLAVGLAAQTSVAQESAARLEALTPVTDDMLAEPASADWLNWRRTYDGHGFSPLQQINRENVHTLQQAWRVPLEMGANMPTPLVHDGVLFLMSTQDTVLALDAVTGTTLWTHQHPLPRPSDPKIGIALHGNKVLVPTSDLRMLALHARTGELIWSHQIEVGARGPMPHSLRSSPLIAGGNVIQGVTAPMVPEGGFIVALDLETGEESWRFHSIARPDAPGGHTWNDLPLAERSGGSVWIPGTYDPALDLVYFGIAPTLDTAPLLPELDRPGISNEALYTNATVALRPATGELVWFHQHMANDQWDLDWSYERQIMDLPVSGVERRVVLTAGKMALFDALDAATGQYVFSIDMGLQNIVTAVDPQTGAKTLNPAAIPNAEKSAMLCPFSAGGRNWQATAYNPHTRMLYVPLAEMCFDGGPTGKPDQLLSTGAAVVPRPLPDTDGRFGRWQAVNLETRKLSWSHRETMTPVSAMLATAGGLVFAGTLDNRFKAFDDRSGEILWQKQLGDVPASFPVSYSVDGKQYVAVVVGQPSLHASIFMGLISGILDSSDTTLQELQRGGPALEVYALP